MQDDTSASVPPTSPGAGQPEPAAQGEDSSPDLGTGAGGGTGEGPADDLASLTLDSSPGHLPLTREAALALDREQLRDVCHDHHVKTWSSDFCILISHRTAYRRLSLHILFPPNYPHEPVHVEAKSDLLPAKLVGRIAAACMNKVKELELLGKPQVAAIYNFVDEQIHENRLLYATPELAKARAMSHEPPEFSLVANDKAGTVKIRAACGQYKCRITLTVPDEYPAQAVAVELTHCNFPESITTVYLLQAREIARKLSLGVDAERAVLQSTTASGQGLGPKSVLGQADENGAAQISTATLHGLKDDVKFLKQATDLRAVDSAYNKQLHTFDYSTQVRRAARRELRQRTRAEAEKERHALQLEAERAEREQLAEWRRLMGYSEEGPRRAVRVLVDFLTRNFIFRLPTEKSAVSGKPVFPADPAELARLIAKGKKTRPVRVPTCGCYFIYAELDDFMRSPPFGKVCPRPACRDLGLVVMHPDWPTDFKKLEKAWAMKKAREREINEVSDLFGLDDEFVA